MTKALKQLRRARSQIWEATRDVPANKTPTSSPAWRRLDVCSKTINGCKIRYQGNNTNKHKLSTHYHLEAAGTRRVLVINKVIKECFEKAYPRARLWYNRNSKR